MSGQSVLAQVTGVLERCGIAFMLTGSFAGAYHGVPRATLDIDLVIDPTRAQLEAFVEAIDAAALYVSADAAREAIMLESLFNVIDPSTGWKVDLIIRKSRAFSREEFSRRMPIVFDGVQLAVATLEDVILSKLEWAAKSESARRAGVEAD
jgi:hypothetical protein